MATAETKAVYTAVLGDDLSKFDVETLDEVLMAEKVGGDNYTKETFHAHVEAIVEHGEGYVKFMQTLKDDANMKTVFAFMISQGPDAIYGLLQSMRQHGLLSKKKVASAAKIATKTRAERAWFRKIWDELSSETYVMLNERFIARLDEFKERFPEIDANDIATLKDLLIVCGKSTLNAGVDHVTHEKTDAKCSIALGWRLDVHSAARNGGWDPKKGEFTKAYLDKQAKNETDEDTSEESTGDSDLN